MDVSPNIKNSVPDFSRLTPRSVVVHNIYSLKQKQFVDASQPGGFFYTTIIDKDIPPTTEEIFDFTSWDVNLTLGLSADSYKITFPNFNGKYTGVFRAGEEIAIFVGYPKDPNNYSSQDLSLLIVGRIDEVNFEFDKTMGEVVEIVGRNYAAPFLDNKVTKRFQNKTATQIIEELVSIYGMGIVSTQIDTSNNSAFNKQFNKTIVTRSVKTGLVLTKNNSDAHTNIPIDVLGQKHQGVARTPKIIQNVIGVNNTVWDVFQRIARSLSDEQTGKEYKVYMGGPNGKVLYFGPRQDYDPKFNQIEPSVTMTYGIDTTRIKLKETMQFLKTRIIMRQYSQKKKKSYDIIVPDDLSPGDMDPVEKQRYLKLRNRYGIRDALYKDSGKFIVDDVQKAKAVGIARLRESARLTFSGQIEGPGEPTVTKDGAVRIKGIPDANGSSDPDFPYKLSQELNAIYYIEGSKHTYSKHAGYQMNLDLSTRRHDRKKTTTQTATTAEQAASNEIEETN